MRSIATGGKTGGVIREAGDVVNDGSEPGVEGGVEVLGLDIEDVDLTETLELVVATRRAANLSGNSVEGLINRGVGGARDCIGTHLDGTLKEGIRVVPQIVVNLHST